MSFEDWQQLWARAGTLTLGDGTEKPAWLMRGRTRGWVNDIDVVQLRRWDLSKPFSLENVYVLYKGDILADGAEIALENAEWEINDREEKA